MHQFSRPFIMGGFAFNGRLPPLRLGFAEPPLPPQEGEEGSQGLASSRLSSPPSIGGEVSSVARRSGGRSGSDWKAALQPCFARTVAIDSIEFNQSRDRALRKA